MIGYGFTAWLLAVPVFVVFSLAAGAGTRAVLAFYMKRSKWWMFWGTLFGIIPLFIVLSVGLAAFEWEELPPEREFIPVLWMMGATVAGVALTLLAAKVVEWGTNAVSSD